MYLAHAVIFIILMFRPENSIIGGSTLKKDPLDRGRCNSGYSTFTLVRSCCKIYCNLFS